MSQNIHTGDNEVLRGIVLPPQPNLISEIRVFRDDLDHVADLIITDPALSAGILMTVNSAAYGLSERISSPRTAVGLLGIERTLNIVNAVMLKASVDDLATGDLTTFWLSSSDVAKACAAISRHLGLGIEDTAYTTGLFHNCGLPLMAARFPDYWDIIVSSYHAVSARHSITAQENECYSTNHTVVGYFVAKAWHLPREIAEAIRFHHNPDFVRETSRAVRTLLCILKIAEHIVGVYHVVGGQRDDREWPSFTRLALDHFGLSEYDFDEMAAIVRERVEGSL